MKPLWVPLWIACAVSGAVLFFLIGKQLEQRKAVESTWGATNRMGLAELKGMLRSGNTTQAPNVEPLLRAEEMMVQQLGKHTPDGAAALNRVANFHALKGDYARAESEYREVIAILSEHLGADHPDVALVQQNLHTLATLKTNRTATPSAIATNAPRALTPPIAAPAQP
jgi:hypothetical protein